MQINSPKFSIGDKVACISNKPIYVFNSSQIEQEEWYIEYTGKIINIRADIVYDKDTKIYSANYSYDIQKDGIGEYVDTQVPERTLTYESEAVAELRIRKRQALKQIMKEFDEYINVVIAQKEKYRKQLEELDNE